MGNELARALEAIIMVADAPVEPSLLAQLLERDVGTIEATLQELMASYEVEDRGFILTKVAGGYRYQSHPDLAPYVERFVLEGQSARLSAAALETLAIVAYKQPISRGQVAAIRGVNVDGVVRTLEQRGYIMEVGRDPGPGSPSLFGTTSVFLEKMGLASLGDLPPIADFVPGAEVVEQLEQGLRAEVTDDAVVGPDAPVPEPVEPAAAAPVATEPEPVEEAPVSDTPPEDVGEPPAEPARALIDEVPGPIGSEVPAVVDVEPLQDERDVVDEMPGQLDVEVDVAPEPVVTDPVPETDPELARDTTEDEPVDGPARSDGPSEEVALRRDPFRGDGAGPSGRGSGDAGAGDRHGGEEAPDGPPATDGPPAAGSVDAATTATGAVPVPGGHPHDDGAGPPPEAGTGTVSHAGEEAGEPGQAPHRDEPADADRGAEAGPALPGSGSDDPETIGARPGRAAEGVVDPAPPPAPDVTPRWP
jgi:segregation and condensation protein B